MAALKDLRGQKFSRLLVLEMVPREMWRERRAEWLCGCDCGNLIHVRGDALQCGGTTNCGCWRNVRHEHTRGRKASSTYRSWRMMIQRCENPRVENFRNYGGRGITVCKRWHRFENFLADMGVRPEGMSIDRIDNDGDYEPGNCRWATRQEQARKEETKLWR